MPPVLPSVQPAPPVPVQPNATVTPFTSIYGYVAPVPGTQYRLASGSAPLIKVLQVGFQNTKALACAEC